MIAEGVRRPGRMEWPASPATGAANGRAALLEALAAYRRGVGEAPVVCKWGLVVRQAHHERIGSHYERRQIAAHPELVEGRGQGDHKGRPYAGVVGKGDHKGRPYAEAVGKGDHKGCPYAGVVGKGDDGPLVFVASNGEVDRHGDTVAPEGWRLDGYRDNPVVLWAHDYRQPAIGRADAVWSDGRALLARLEFAPTEFAGQVERLYRQGYQRGVSVGFRPLRFEERRDPVNGAFLGIRFLEQELLEISAVPVPANGDALLGDHKGSPYAEDALTPALSRRERGQVTDARKPAVDEVVGLLRGLRG